MFAEHEAFKLMTDGLLQATNGAKAIAFYRPDTARQWEKIAEALNVIRESAFRLAGEGVVGKG